MEKVLLPLRVGRGEGNRTLRQAACPEGGGLQRIIEKRGQEGVGGTCTHCTAAVTASWWCLSEAGPGAAPTGTAKSKRQRRRRGERAPHPRGWREAGKRRRPPPVRGRLADEGRPEARKQAKAAVASPSAGSKLCTEGHARCAGAAANAAGPQLREWARQAPSAPGNAARLAAAAAAAVAAAEQRRALRERLRVQLGAGARAVAAASVGFLHPATSSG